MAADETLYTLTAVIPIMHTEMVGSVNPNDYALVPAGEEFSASAVDAKRLVAPGNATCSAADRKKLGLDE